MFGWLRPKSPLDPPEKLWIEQRMSWLANTFGVRRLREATVVLPTPEFFPDPYRGADADVRALFGRVCGYMGIDPGRADLGFFEEEDQGIRNAAGVYVPGKKEQILVNRAQLADPMALVATLTHELSHLLLLGDGRLAEGEPDMEYVTDLLTVFLGMGTFGANSAIRESYKRFAATMYVWSIGTQGYLSERMYGYALGLFAWVRGERKPAWVGHLRLNVRTVCKQGLAYLVKTGDTRFREQPDEGGASDEHRLLAERAADLQAPSSGARLAALWDLKAMGAKAEAALPGLLRTLRDEDPFIRAEGMQVLAGLGPAAEAAIPDLLATALQGGNDSLCQYALAAARAADAGSETSGGNDSLCQYALAALGRIGRRPEGVVPVLVSFLKSPESALRREAVLALRGFGPAAADAVTPLAALLQDPEATLAADAAEVLGAVGRAALPAVPDLILALKGGEGDLPGSAAYALGLIGPVTDRVIPALRKALKHPDSRVRQEAARALRQIAPPGDSAKHPPPPKG
jgi:HEAT repeat protein